MYDMDAPFNDFIQKIYVYIIKINKWRNYGIMYDMFIISPSSMSNMLLQHIFVIKEFFSFERRLTKKKLYYWVFIMTLDQEI